MQVKTKTKQMKEEVQDCIPGIIRRGDDNEDGNISMIDDNPGLWSGTQFKKSNTSLQTTGFIANHIMDKVIANHIMDRVITFSFNSPLPLQRQGGQAMLEVWEASKAGPCLYAAKTSSGKSRKQGSNISWITSPWSYLYLTEFSSLYAH